MVPSFIHSFCFGVGSGAQSGGRKVSPRNPRAAQPSPPPHGSCSPRAGGLRIAPPSKRADNSWEGEGHRGQAPKAGKNQVGEQGDCPSAGLSYGSEPRT